MEYMKAIQIWVTFNLAKLGKDGEGNDGICIIDMGHVLESTCQLRVETLKLKVQTMFVKQAINCELSLKLKGSNPSWPFQTIWGQAKMVAY